MRIDSFFDRALYGTGIRGPWILYHYTTWEAAENILRSQRFWATAHDCTNDQEELTYADATILEVIRDQEASSSNVLVRKILRLYQKAYAYSRIGASRRTYLACFSQARDDPHQWAQYGVDGEGVCLGLRLFGIPPPRVPKLATAIMPVNYGNQELREKLSAWQQRFAEILSPGDDIEHNWRLALGALEAPATSWALTTKALHWQREREVRMIFLVRDGQRIAPTVCVRPNGSIKRYLEVPLTTMPRMPVEEFIIGPNQDVAAGTERATRLLTELKYRKVQDRVIVSGASLPKCSVTISQAVGR